MLTKTHGSEHVEGEVTSAFSGELLISHVLIWIVISISHKKFFCSFTSCSLVMLDMFANGEGFFIFILRICPGINGNVRGYFCVQT